MKFPHLLGGLPVAIVLAAGPVQAQARRPACAPGNAGLTLPPGFCALVVADSVGAARHLVVAPNGDVLVALRSRRNAPGGVVVLRDTSGDGVADVRRKFGPEAGGTGIALHGGALYFATDDAVLRWAWPGGQLQPGGGPPDTVAKGLLNKGQHAAKGIAISRDGVLYVNIGAPSNACQESDRAPGSKGVDPCPLLDSAGGIWGFDASKLNQTQGGGGGGIRFATGLRNTLSLAIEPTTGALYGAMHGRDQLAGNWPALFTESQSAELPAEELVRIERNGDYGWPYCYYDGQRRQLVLAPEYGGDGRTPGRCTAARPPAAAFPAHWAPDALLFYTGTQFPAKYAGGAFIAFHGSWNRAPLPQAGYQVVFVPFARGEPASSWETFADGFAGAERSPQNAQHRPAGLAQGPDGSLYVADDQAGRIYRIVYTR